MKKFLSVAAILLLYSGIASARAVKFTDLAILDANRYTGIEYFCSDCNALSVCTGSGSGAIAIAQNGVWNCSYGGSSTNLAPPIRMGTGATNYQNSVLTLQPPTVSGVGLTINPGTGTFFSSTALVITAPPPSTNFINDVILSNGEFFTKAAFAADGTHSTIQWDGNGNLTFSPGHPVLDFGFNYESWMTNTNNFADVMMAPDPSSTKGTFGYQLYCGATANSAPNYSFCIDTDGQENFANSSTATRHWATTTFDTNGPVRVAAGVMQYTSAMGGKPAAIAGLPTCNGTSEGAWANITDNTAACAYGGTPLNSGGGTVNCPVWCDGANWIIH